MNINTIKNDLNKAVDNLSMEDKADIYFESRKKALKHINYGELEDAYKEILRGDKLHVENSRHDTNRLFHKAHHRHIEYDCAYNQFKFYRVLLLSQNEKSAGLTNMLIEITKIKALITEDNANPEQLIDYLNNEYNQIYEKLKESVKLWAAMHYDLMNIEDFSKYDYFADIDPIGYTVEDLDVDRFNKISGEIVAKMNNANDAKIKKYEESINRLRS